MTLIEAAKMALEYGSFPPGGGIVREIRQAIEKAERQDGPINDGWQITVAHGHSGYGVYAHMENYPEEGAVLIQAIDHTEQHLEMVEQQGPLAWKYKTYGNLHHQDFGDSIPLYTAPPKREWQGLTDEQVRECSRAMDAEPLAEGWTELIKFARAIESKTKENNT